MPIAINSQFPSPCLSADLPEEVSISAQDEDTSAQVSIIVDGQAVFQTTLYAFGHNMALHDIRSVIEDAIRENNNSTASCRITATDGSDTVQTSTFLVIFSQFSIPQPATFLLQHFLTTRRSFRITRDGTQTLSWFSRQGEQVSAWIEATVMPSNATAPIVVLLNQTTIRPTNDTVYQYAISVADLQTQVSTRGRLLAFKIVRGQRGIHFYVTDEQPALSVSFLNAFNLPELAEIYGTMKMIQETESNEAVCGRKRILFDRNDRHNLEIETTVLSYDEAKWLRQLLASRFITVPVNGTQKEILIDSSQLEISDDNTAANRLKFTCHYANDIQYHS